MTVSEKHRAALAKLKTKALTEACKDVSYSQSFESLEKKKASWKCFSSEKSLLSAIFEKRLNLTIIELRKSKTRKEANLLWVRNPQFKKNKNWLDAIKAKVIQFETK